jgi:hypothetical protein
MATSLWATPGNWRKLHTKFKEMFRANWQRKKEVGTICELGDLAENLVEQKNGRRASLDFGKSLKSQENNLEGNSP